MRTWTAHLHEGRSPVLVPEAFSRAAAFLGPIWLASKRAWLPALLTGAAAAGALLLTPSHLRGVTLIALGVAFGIFGNDLRRLSLGLRGYVMTDVVAARDDDAALSRLLHARPDLIERMSP